MKKSVFVLIVFQFLVISCQKKSVEEHETKGKTPEVVEEEILVEYVEEYLDDYPSEVEEPIKGGVLKIGISNEPKHLNSAIRSGTATGTISSQIFAPLLKLDRNWKLYPNLAKQWEVSEDGKEITFYLHEKAYFHDMKEINVEDVAFSLELIKSEHPFSTMLSSVIEVEEIDKKVGIIHLEKPSPVVLTALASPMVPILPKHIYGDEQDIKNHPANMKPVGSGPFKLVEWKPENEIILERFDNYFLEGLPYLDRITYKYIPIKSRSVAFENKAVDIIGFAEEKDIFSLATKENIDHLYKDSSAYGGVGPIMWLAFNTKKAPFNDVRVRQAIAYTIDRDLIVKTLLGNLKHIATGPLYPGTPFYTKDHNLYDVDIEKANNLLDEAGYKRDENGIRFSVSLDSIPNELSRKASYFIKDSLLRKIGIEVSVVEHNNLKEWSEGIANHDFDITTDIVFNWGDPVIGVHRTYLSGNIKKGVIWSNTQSYINLDVDRILKEAKEETDFSKRKALYYDFQETIANDLPVYPLLVIPYVTIYDKRIRNMNDSIWGLMFPLDKVYWKEE